MLFYAQNSAYFDSNNIEASSAVIDTITIQNSTNIGFIFWKMHKINIQNIELENNFHQTPDIPAMFYTESSDIVTITNLTVKNHCSRIFWLESVLTQKFYNCTFTNITINDDSLKNQTIIISTRRENDVDRNNTEQPVTIFQDFYVDVTIEYIISN